MTIEQAPCSANIEEWSMAALGVHAVDGTLFANLADGHVLQAMRHRNFAGIDTCPVDAAPVIERRGRLGSIRSLLVECVDISATILTVADQAKDRGRVNGQLDLAAGAFYSLFEGD